MHWIYNLPNWLLGALSVLVFCAFGITGLAVTRKWVPSLHHVTLSHNDIVGYYFGAITVLYGITLGLLMVDVWSTFTEAEGKVDREAGALAALYLDVSHYPDPSRHLLQVIDTSWPQQRRGLMPKGNLVTIAVIAYDLATFEPTSNGEKDLHAESYRQFNDLVQYRRSRLLSVTAGLSGALWTLVLLGAGINIAVTWCFHLQNQRMHVWMTVLISSLLGLMIFLLAAMDHPYLGRLSVSSEPFQLVYEQVMDPRQIAPGSDNSPSAP
jgi:hypothetical protein